MLMFKAYVLRTGGKTWHATFLISRNLAGKCFKSFRGIKDKSKTEKRIVGCDVKT